MEDPKLLSLTVVMLVKLSEAMDNVARARVVVADAHRSFGEGDRAIAEARKLNYEAEAVMMDARARNARDVTRSDIHDQQSREDEAAALAALRGMAVRSRSGGSARPSIHLCETCSSQ
jgi:hypothetical protein